MLTIPFIPICFRWLQWLVRKKQSYCTIPKIWRISGGFRLFSPLWYRCLLHSFWYQPILKYTHFTSLIFCLLICSASELSVTCPIRGSPLASSRGSILVLMPSIDASLLPFIFSPVLSVASSLSPLFILSVCCSISSLSPPTNLSLSACLSPSFPHLVCIFTATTRLLSLPSISPIAVSPFFFFSCPSPFHLIHSPTLSPPPPAISPSHCGDWQESLALPQATCLRPHSSIHLLLPFFFLLLVCFMNDDHQTDAGEKSKSRGGRFGEQNSPFESEMCHHGNVC